VSWTLFFQIACLVLLLGLLVESWIQAWRKK
jgi:hypothetical protein